MEEYCGLSSVGVGPAILVQPFLQGLFGFPDVLFIVVVIVMDGVHHITLFITKNYVLGRNQILPEGVHRYEVDRDVVLVENPF